MKYLHKNEASSNSENPLEVGVAWFSYMKSTEPDVRRLAEVLDDIRNGRWRREVDALRVIYAEQGKSEAYTKRKEKLPSFYISGTASTAKLMLTHSGLLQVDLDGLGERFSRLRAELENDPHTAAVFTSISGDGIKIAFRLAPLAAPLDKTEHGRAFAAVTAYFEERYGVTPDAQCKNVNRHCLISYDPALFWNEGALPFDWRMFFAGKNEGEEEEGLASCTPNPSNTSLPSSTSSTSATTPTTDTTYQASVEDKLAGRKLRAEYRKKHPEEAQLFEVLVDRLHPATPGERNGILVKLVTYLYRAVCPSLLRDFATKAHTLNPGFYKDPLSEHQAQVEAHFAAVARSYPESLSEQEREFYQTYNAAEQTAFRIVRDFALYTGQATLPPPLFICPAGHLATRLRNGGQASRLLERLRKDGVIEIAIPGTRRMFGVAGKATVYRWCLSSPPSAVR